VLKKDGVDLLYCAEGSLLPVILSRFSLRSRSGEADLRFGGGGRSADMDCGFSIASSFFLTEAFAGGGGTRS